jgi:radical SAM superfamily enzyme YgiQ (UPF0313 family)
MKILVINISLRPESPVKMFPIGLGFITTAMKNAGFEFDLIDIDSNRYSDSEVDDLIAEENYDVVCMGCLVTGYKKIKRLCSVIRKVHPHAKIIVGNSVATSIPEILLNNTEADVAVMYEGDETIVDLLNCIKNGENLGNVHGLIMRDNGSIFRTGQRQIISDISSIPHIDFNIFNVEDYIINNNIHESKSVPLEYIRALPVNTSRGCIANCTFCYHVFKGIRYRYRTPGSIVSEIKELVHKYNINYIQLWDELTFFSKKQALALAQEIIDAKIRVYWTASCRANLFTKDKDLQIIEKLKEAGCCGIQYSLESSDPTILKDMNKKISVEHFSKQTKLIQEAGITTWTSLVFGYPQETPETIAATLDCCIENNIYPSTGFLLPQPGSVMYEYALKNGYIEDEEEYILSMGDRQDLTMNMTSMSDEEFEEAVLCGLKKCNEHLNMGLPEDRLIKTKSFRSANK